MDSLSREYAGRAKFVKINVDENEELASRYGVQSIPTVIIFGSGRALDKVIGVAQAQLYRSKIDAAIAGGKE
jgi:thioredoxin 1